MIDRTSKITRKTLETSIELTLNIDGSGKTSVQTGIGFLDHMLIALGRHAQFNIELKCMGDLEVDDHHTVEDCALVLGQAISEALTERRGIARFGYAYAPLDEALARAVIDFSGRPFSVIDLGLKRESIGPLACENIEHFFSSLAMNSKAAIHIDVLRGSNDHHRAEAAFKALAGALRQSVIRDDSSEVPSTKGVLV